MSRALALRLALALAACACGPAGRGVPVRPAEAAGTDATPLTMPAQLVDARAFGRAVASVERAPAEPMPGVRAVIVPHHWPAGRLIVASLRDLAATEPCPATGRPASLACVSSATVASVTALRGNGRRWQRVIVLGPDHRDAGLANAVTSARDWSTPAGVLRADPAVADLIARGLLRSDDAVLAEEHAISGILPALARYLGDARLLPIVVRGSAPPSEQAALASALSELMEPATVLIVSVDFSHDASPRLAAQRDDVTLRALSSLDAGRVLALGRRGMDAWTAMAVALRVMGRVGADRLIVRERIDGHDLAGYVAGPVTSYVSAYFASE